MKKIVGWIVVIGMFLTPTLALAEGEKEFFAASTEENTISETDLKLLFGQKAVNEHGNSVQLAMLTDTEMKEIEGTAVQLVAVGAIIGGRFIAQRWVIPKIAQSMVRRGAANIWAPNRSIAKNIAGRGAIREYHPGAGARYTHFHTANRSGSHVWYGRPR